MSAVLTIPFSLTQRCWPKPHLHESSLTTTGSVGSHQGALRDFLKGKDGALAHEVGGHALQLTEELQQVLGPTLVLRDECGHLRVDRLPQLLKQVQFAQLSGPGGGKRQGSE